MAGDYPVDVEHACRCQCHAVAEIYEAKAVRPDKPHSRRRRDRLDFLLRPSALGVGLRETGRDDDAAADIGRGAFLQRPRHGGSRYRDDRDIDLWRIANMGVASAALHGVATWIDRDGLAPEAVKSEIVHDATAPLAAIVRGSEDGH